VWGFLVRDRRVTDGPSLAEFWGAPQDAEEESMIFQRPAPRPTASAMGSLEQKKLAG
ncbi:MAG: magnesium-protoporphyrin IX monomethyl ester cyclase, partial [Mesorhizobium sp.]